MSRGLRLLVALAALVVFLVVLRTCASSERVEFASSVGPKATPELADAMPEPGDLPRDPRALVEPAPQREAVPPAAELAAPPAAPRLALRVVDEGGLPLRSAALRVGVVALPLAADPLDAPDDGLHVTTDDEGRLELPVPPPVEPGERRYVVLRMGAPPHAARPAREPRIGALELPLAFDVESHVVHELGDCVLALEPLLVTGRVVDEQGLGVGDAWLDVSFPGQGEARHLARIHMPSRPVVDADGRFEVRSRARPVEVQVGASAKGRVATSVRGIEPGVADVELVLALSHAGSLAGRVLADEGVPLAGLELRSVHRDGGRPRGVAIHPVTGSFRIEDVEPGTVDLDFVIHASGASLLELEGVQVLPDGPSVDPRLAEVDLRGRVDVLRLRLLDSDDRPIAERPARVVDPVGRGDVHSTDELGRLAAPVPTGVVPWTVRVDGFAEASVVPLREERVLRLSPR